MANVPMPCVGADIKENRYTQLKQGISQLTPEELEQVTDYVLLLAIQQNRKPLPCPRPKK